MNESSGVSPCIGSDNTILVIPTRVTEVEKVYRNVIKYLNVSHSGYYAWLTWPAKIISESELMLYRRAKSLFKENRQRLGSRQLMKNLRK